MVRGHDPESRPISVAELLARAREEGDSGVAVQPGGRRRGRPDSISVAELTGEIPRVEADTPAPETPTAAAAPETPAPPSETSATVPSTEPVQPDTAEHARHGRDAEDAAADETSGAPNSGWNRYGDSGVDGPQPIPPRYETADAPTWGGQYGTPQNAEYETQYETQQYEAPQFEGQQYEGPHYGTQQYEGHQYEAQPADTQSHPGAPSAPAAPSRYEAPAPAAPESYQPPQAYSDLPADSHIEVPEEVPGAQAAAAVPEGTIRQPVVDENLDFDSYRNFDDIADEDQPKKRRLFGRKRKKGDTGAIPTAGAVAETVPQVVPVEDAPGVDKLATPNDSGNVANASDTANSTATDGEPASYDNPADGSFEADAATDEAPPRADGTPTGPGVVISTPGAPSVPLPALSDEFSDGYEVSAGPASSFTTGQFSAQSVTPESDSPEADTAQSGSPVSDPLEHDALEHESDEVAGYASTTEASGWRTTPSERQGVAGYPSAEAPQPGWLPAVPNEPDTGLLTSADVAARLDAEQPEHGVVGDSGEVTSDPSLQPDEHPTAAPTAAQEKANRHWFALAAELLGGIAVGVGVFFGFIELWKWNQYFAVAATVVVIFALVIGVQLWRKSHDMVSTLLALLVGLIITIGPLLVVTVGS